MGSSNPTTGFMVATSYLPDFQPVQIPYPSNISSYFRRPSRVVKPSSRGNSPRTLVRRKTTAATAPPRPRCVADGAAPAGHYSRGSHPADKGSTARPLSWHPSSMDRSGFRLSPSMCFDHLEPTPADLSAPNFVTTEVNGMITPMAQPYTNPESFEQESFTPLEEPSLRDFGSRYAYLNEFSADQNPHWVRESMPNRSSTSTSQPLDGGSMQPTSSGAFPSSGSGTFPSTAPLTPEFRPRQVFPTANPTTSSLFSKPKPGSDELIGMGLYDPPSPSQAMGYLGDSTLIFSFRPSPGKGLKLEETFQPSSTQDDEEEEEDEDDESDADSHEQYRLVEAPVPPLKSDVAVSYPPVTMAAPTTAHRSFFFDHADGYEDDYMLHQFQMEKVLDDSWTPNPTYFGWI